MKIDDCNSGDEKRTEQIKLEIVSAEESIFSGSVKYVVVSGKEGELGIFPRHTQLLAAIRPGEVKIIDLDNLEKLYYVSGGFVEVQPDLVTILADTVLRAEEIDQKRAEEAKKEAEKQLATIQRSDRNYSQILVKLHKALAQLRISSQIQRRR